MNPTKDVLYVWKIGREVLLLLVVICFATGVLQNGAIISLNVLFADNLWNHQASHAFSSTDFLQNIFQRIRISNSKRLEKEQSRLGDVSSLLVPSHRFWCRAKSSFSFGLNRGFLWLPRAIPAKIQQGPKNEKNQNFEIQNFEHENIYSKYNISSYNFLLLQWFLLYP